MTWLASIVPSFLRTGARARAAQPDTGQRVAAADAEVWMVFGMRVLLSVSALLTLYIGPGGVTLSGSWTWLVFAAYVLHSLTLLVIAGYRAGFSHGPLVYWVDIGWYGLIVWASGGTASPFFSFFFFAILAASFRHGFDAGAKLTLGSVGIVALSVLAAQGLASLHILLLRATFVLALGYMVAFWGGLAVDQRRRLALLRDVSRLSNPRFGVQHTLDSLMEKILRFYGGDTCVLLMQDSHERWTMNTAHHPKSGRAIGRSRPDADDVAPLLQLGDGAILYLAPPRHFNLFVLGAATALRQGIGKRDWHRADPDACGHVADLLDAEGFVSASLPLRKGSGRIFVTGARLRRSDAGFLRHIVQQAFPVIETIDLLDRLASEAAFRERQTIARDLHDSTIQPYIGLRHAVAAIRNQAGDGSPVAPELDRLMEMCSGVIGDMRDFAQRFRSGRQEEPELLIALRRQLHQVESFYGVDVMLEMHADSMVNDRMAAEVFQIVTEGINNICKHTRARTAGVVVEEEGGMLAIDIFNPATVPGQAPLPFVPRSIAERVQGLGGKLDVEADGRQTLLRIRIPN
ncbi:sensor histidine kinase [Massilia aurea]|uniref:sensor histidine kinase n=1 Tax=Massilia aurea TaxID=373040 RepID=UPI000F2DDC5C|nr:histidine kinase [Massilia aurea]